MQKTKVAISVLVVTGIVQSGCAAFQAHGETIEYNSRLKDGVDIQLVQQFRRDAIQSGAEHNYANLRLQLRNDDHVIIDEGAGLREGRFEDDPFFVFGRLEGRTDQNQEKIWIIEHDPDRIIASLDRSTSKCTGIGEVAPTWATLDAGNPLASEE